MKGKLTPTRLIIRLFSGILLTGAVAVLALSTANAGTKAQPGNSNSFGKSLAEWQELYQRWAWGNLLPATDELGNAVAGKVVLLEVPNTPGDGTPGALDVRLLPGEAFVLPFWGLLGTSYNDGTPPDAFVDRSLFETVNLKITLDGVTIVDGRNMMQYFTEFLFIPAIPFDYGTMNGIVWSQSFGFVHGPLTVGKHTLTLDAVNTQPIPPNFGGGYVAWHNTWHISVGPMKK